ncbi:MAG: peptidase families s8 and s53 domain-containing protein, partial [Acidimicrobiaceae bacterium]
MATGAPGTATLQGTLTQTVVNGVATFSNVSYNKAETMSIAAISVPAYTAATSTNVIVTTAAASKLVLTAVPAANTITAGTRGAYTVTVQDQFNNTQASHGGVTIPLTTTSASTSKAFYNAATAGSVITQLVLANGTASGNFWYYDEAAAAYTITASSTPLTAATHALTVASAAATRLAVTGGATMAAGDTNAITITAYDAFNNVAAATYTGSKNVVFSGANASPTPSATAPTCAGTAFGTSTALTFTAGVGSCSMRLYKAEVVSLKATEGALTTATTD